MTKPLRFRLNDKLRQLATRAIDMLTFPSKEARLNLLKERIERILLVRANFRMGNSILALPAISAFRGNLPGARIDFIGSPISRTLFQNLPINHHYEITRRFPDSSWAYFTLLKTLRSVNYDLAVELSCSQSSMGSFIVGFSRPRFRVGCQGKWDHWFNVKIPRPLDSNKYRALSGLIAALGLTANKFSPASIVSDSEKVEGRKKIEAIISKHPGPVVGIFVGGRESRGKRWPLESYLKLAESLHEQGERVAVFAGPEERKLLKVLKHGLPSDVPLVFEASLRTFAAMISNCDLFITCDSGPMHLACALGVRTIAIFEKINIKRWGPPPDLARIVYRTRGVLADDVVSISLAQLLGRRVSSSDKDISLGNKGDRLVF